MRFIKTPITYEGDSLAIARSLEDHIAKIDNFIELIVFSPRGSFAADDEFGFEYWNHEYSNIHCRNFNNGQNETFINGNGGYYEVTLRECKESIENSLRIYEPQLKQIGVFIELNSVTNENGIQRKLLSKYEVVIKVTGMLDNGLGTMIPYKKEISFLMEPTVKRIKI